MEARMFFDHGAEARTIASAPCFVWVKELRIRSETESLRNYFESEVNHSRNITSDRHDSPSETDPVLCMLAR